MFPRPLVLLQCSIHNSDEELLLIDDIFTQLLILSVSYLPRSQILPSLIHPAASFTEQSFSFFDTNGDREGCGGSSGEMAWVAFTSPQLTE